MSILRLLRARHWIKNFFVMAGPFFAGKIFEKETLMLSVITFIVFSLMASVVYVFNDIIDRAQDRKHPLKKERPIASGRVTVGTGCIIIALLGTLATWIMLQWVPQIAAIMVVYLVLNLLYTVWLKHQPIVDILLIALFYVLRILVGGVATGIFISNWLILCTVFLSLMLILGKRRAEFNQSERRKVLEAYSLPLIEQLLTICTGLTLICYSLYTVLVMSSPWAVYSIFFVLLGIFRYLTIVHASKVSEFPEKMITSDRMIVTSIAGWILFMVLIFY